MSSMENEVVKKPSSSTEAAQRIAEKVVPACMSRTCFIKQCGLDGCWGCEDSKVERARVAAIITTELATAQVVGPSLTTDELRYIRLHLDWDNEIGVSVVAQIEKKLRPYIPELRAFDAERSAPKITKEPAASTSLDSAWRGIESAPKDGSSILLLSIPYEMDAGPNGIHQIPAKVAIGHWWAEGTSWVDDLGRMDGKGVQVNQLGKTGTWLSGGGWFQPNEISHWQPLPPLPVQEESK